MDEKISYAKTVYGKEEIEAVVKCLRESTQMGVYSREFEKKIANLFSKKHCLYVNSGSSGLYIGIEAFDFPPNSEVITPALTFSTTVGCLIKNKLMPVFTDVEELTYCIDISQIEPLINEKTVAILAPNLLGNLCDWKSIREIANKYNLIVIEDSADTLGGEIDNKPAGIFTDMSITSFYGSHIINCAGNGGALAINDSNVMERSKLLRSWGRSSSLFDENSESIDNRFNINLDGIDYDAKFVFEKIGYNLEGSEIGAAFGLIQLKKLIENIKIRRDNFRKQVQFFKSYENFFKTPLEKSNHYSGWLAFPVIINEDAPFKRKDFQIFLEKNNIQTRVVFTGNITRQPMMKGLSFKKTDQGLKNSDQVMQRGVLLPLHHGMTNKMFNILHEKIKIFLHSY
tara:strand:+ start:314 stop:1510 length:1197 start_codon:yes stop_codon:yes gene_type:complete